MHRACVVVVVALGSGCAGSVALLRARDAERMHALAWPGAVVPIAAAGEDEVHRDVDTEPEPTPSQEPVPPAEPAPPPVDEPAEARMHRFGVHVGLQTYVAISALDADAATPEALFGVYYRLAPSRGPLAYEFGYQRATATLEDYSTDVVSDSTVGMWRGSALYYFARSASGMATYVLGGLSLVDELASYENRHDGYDLREFSSSYGAMSLGVGQELLKGAVDVRYDMTLPIGSGSGSSYHYLTVGYTF
jgi:hypothetical protein